MDRIKLLLIVILLLSSCKKENTTSVDFKKELKIYDVQPMIGKPSDEVIITGAGFDSLYWRNIIRFNGVQAQIDSGSKHILYTRVPLYAATGSVIVYTTKESLSVLVPIDSVIGQHFTVLPFGEQYLNLISYTGPSIDESQSSVTNCRNQSVGWSISEHQDTIILSQGACVGDDSYITRTLRFYIHVNDSLPRSVIGLVKDNEIQYTAIDTLKGYVAIQEWKPMNIICGRVTVYDQHYYWWDFNFWYKY